MKHEPLGTVPLAIKELLGVETGAEEIRYSRENLIRHMEKRGHFDVLSHVDDLRDILTSPDFIGVNPREKGVSLEYVKRYDNNVLVAIKLHQSGEFFYVPTMYALQEYKLQTRIRSGRLKKVDRSNK